MAFSAAMFGHVASDPKVNEFENSRLLSFRVATDRYGMWGKTHQDKTDFMTVKWWVGKKMNMPTVNKGDRVYIEGTGYVDQYESKAGDRRQDLVVEVKRVKFIRDRKATPDTPEEPEEEPYDGTSIPF